MIHTWLAFIVLIFMPAVFWSMRSRERRRLPEATSCKLDALPLPSSTVHARPLPSFWERVVIDNIRRPLLSPWERAMTDHIRRQLSPGQRLCPQVRLLDMLSVQDKDRARQRVTCNRLGSRSVDFAVTDEAGKVLLVIELNDRRHDQPERRRRDALVRAALGQARIPMAVFRLDQPIDLRFWVGACEQNAPVARLGRCG